MCVFVASAEWSDGGAVWGMPAAIFWFGMERGVPSSTAAGHTVCLFRFVWNPVGLCSSCLSWLLFSECVSCSGSALFDWIFYERFGLQEQRRWSVSCSEGKREYFWLCTPNVIQTCVSTIIDDRVPFKHSFCFRKDKILFSYCLASKSCSNHCVSRKNLFLTNIKSLGRDLTWLEKGCSYFFLSSPVYSKQVCTFPVQYKLH